MHYHNIMRSSIPTFVLLAQLFQEASITTLSSFLCIILILLRILFVQLILSKLQHLL
jgi:hypothetical protein